MKNLLIITLVLAALGGGASVWWLLSQPELKPDELTQAPALAAAKSGKESAHLEAPAREPIFQERAPEPAVKNAKPQTPPADPNASGERPDGTAPIDIEGIRDTDHFELKYPGATIAELKLAYKSMDELYRMNRDGQGASKTQRLNPEALEQLAREVAWLKAQAYGDR